MKDVAITPLSVFNFEDKNTGGENKGHRVCQNNWK